MMFKKYISKISNTIGTVNYLQHKAKDNRHNHHLYDDGYDVCDIDPSTINKMEIDLSASGSKNNLLDGLPPNTRIILSAAIANLRNTLLFYPLVFLTFICLSVFGLCIKRNSRCEFYAYIFK